MFPLSFPYGVLQQHAEPGQWVLDPFCGRGTTNYASRLLGLPSIGIDSSPVAAAVAEAKLANATPDEIIEDARAILDSHIEPKDVPDGEFWEWAFHKDVLTTLCRYREALIEDCVSDSRKALRTILLGALHGPQPKSQPSY
ncbi:MAG: DNA modification methylase, partial [Chloroflexi bacterium]|nr:DNA modification methylase [Chloroflexota bacterium]